MLRSSPVDDASAVEPSRTPLRARRRRGNREARAAGVVARAAGLLARGVNLIAGVAVLIIVAGILFVVLGANPSNGVVSEVHGWARWLADPFDGMFSLHSARAAIAVNWGIACAVYLLAAALIVRLLTGGRRDRVSGSYAGQEEP